MMYTLDTNAIIYYSQDEPKAASVLENIFQINAPIFVSTLTELELFSSVSISTQEENTIERFLSEIRIIPLTSDIARIAADLRRLHPRIKAFDSAIAATALFTNSTLVTRNLKDFEPIQGLELLAI